MDSAWNLFQIPFEGLRKLCHGSGSHLHKILALTSHGGTGRDFLCSAHAPATTPPHKAVTMAEGALGFACQSQKSLHCVSFNSS